MQILSLIREKFAAALKPLLEDEKLLAASLERIVPSREPQLADYQANIAMPLQKPLGKPPLEIAKAVVANLDMGEICSDVSIAGQGYINLKLSPAWLAKQLEVISEDERLGVGANPNPKTIIVDYSSPNVAKPMHVGHIRSTVIGDAITKVLRFLGHRVITDNHLGDWGTQFGMIIYGYKHFRNEAAFEQHPVGELSRLYRHVQNLIGYQDAVASLPKLEEAIVNAKKKFQLVQAKVDAAPQDKKTQKELAAANNGVKQAEDELLSAKGKIEEFEKDSANLNDAKNHPKLGEAVLVETAKLHRGDKENLDLWNAFLPNCKAEIHAVYQRLGIEFDYEYGESFYHDLLGPVVEELFAKSLAVQSGGAICVFLDGFDAPMIVQKQDGAYLYATTDIATAMFREREFEPDVSLYVVDHRQGEHFNKLFAVLHKIGLNHTQFKHVSFGTVLGKDGRPFKTRSGSVVGLESLLDEAVERAWQVVCDPGRLQVAGIEMDENEKRHVAETVGLGAIKYADLCHNRSSDYTFDVDNMVKLTGNTSTYIQYSVARTKSLFRNAADLKGWTEEKWSKADFQFVEPIELAIGLQLIRFEEMLIQSMQDYTPNLITEYLFELAKQFGTFFDQCSVLKAETEQIAFSRLRLASVVGNTLSKGLELLGIRTVDRM